MVNERDECVALRFFDIDKREVVASIPLAKLPIPRVGEVIILHAPGDDFSVEWTITGVKHDYQISSLDEVVAASVTLDVRCKKPLE